MKPKIIPATRAMLEAMDEHPRGSGRAFAGVMDGEILGVCGYYLDRSRVVLYAKVKPEHRRWKKAIVQAAHMVTAAAAHIRAPIVAVAQADIPGSARMLEALGFEQVDRDIYWRPPWQPQV